MSIEKKRTAVENITLRAATFHNVEVQPALINFFYGNNGTGKSTIAKAIGDDEGLAWHEGKSADDYSVLVYNQEFVSANFQGYGHLKGVFTIGEENVEVQKLIDEKTNQKTDLDKLYTERTTERSRKEAQRGTLLGTFQDNCWNKVKTIREGFDSTQGGFKRKAQFTDKVLTIASPVEHDLATLEVLYETAFSADAQVYSEFQPLGGVIKLKGSPGNDLLGKPITSSNDSPFADFLKRVQVSDWVKQGHDRYTEAADGKCPYCQQELPDDFEEELAACFDAQYQQDINDLRQFREDYESDMYGFIVLLKANLDGAYPKLDTTEYSDKFAVFERTVEVNLQRIADKIKEPSSVQTLEDVKTVRQELNDIIEGFNKTIKETNDVVRAKAASQAQCKTQVWELIAFTLQDTIASYKASLAKLEAEIKQLSDQIKTDYQTLQTLETDINELNLKIVSVTYAINGINNLLRDSGFQGFFIREKRDVKNAYEIVRSDGRVAENLSEGERNFIAFLYFYFQVKGSTDSAELSKAKIVVIDDPVSSMDSSVLFIVSTLVREMIEICYNNVEYRETLVNGNFIKQIFILTHNVYFHREVTYNQLSRERYPWVSLFVVNKKGNISSIKPCVRSNPMIPSEIENFNPVQNTYAALWGEYKEVDTTIPLLSVIRRILEYYFMQLCGYEGTNIRKEVLEKNRAKFVEELEDGSQDLTNFNLASSMLSYISAASIGVNDGQHYIEDNTDAQQYRDVFKMIFVSLGQEQHYQHMMTSEEE